MSSTPILPLATWASGTNQNSLPANDNALRLEALSREVISKTTTAQPGSPSDRDVYVIPAAATGTQWATFTAGDIAIFVVPPGGGGTWHAWAPVEGLRLVIAGSRQVYDSGAWGADPTVSGGAGASVGVQYVAETGSTADSDPGAGLMKWNNATQASATVLYLDDNTDDGVALTSVWPALDAGGFVYLQHATDQDTWQIWEVTGVTDATGYVKLAVNLLANGGSFADADPMLVTIQNGAGGTALTNFVEAINTASPNDTVPVVSLSATNAATNVDVALKPKGTGAALSHIPDGTAAGGAKRGANAVDLQTKRSTAAQVASGSAATISGGENNTASAASCVVSGGTSNTASNTCATVAGGNSNTAGNTFSSIGGGTSNTANGVVSTVAGGDTNAASGSYAAIGGGQGNTASGTHSCVPGGQNNLADGNHSRAAGNGARVRGIHAASAQSSGTNLGTAGDSQRREFVLVSDTTNATPEAMTTTNAGVTPANQVVLPNTSAFIVRGDVVARQNTTGDCKSWEFRATIKRGASAAATAIVGAAVVTVADADAGASAWTLAISADTTNGALTVQVTGEAAKTIKWVANCRAVEVVG